MFRHNNLQNMIGVFALLFLFQLQFLVLAQDQSGFISLDCGLPNDSNYTDPTTGLNYTSDASFINTGVSRSIAPQFRTNNVHQPMNQVRAFPSGTRNCYNFKLKTRDKYLIRAGFLYGNYDAENKLPSFELHLGPNNWTSVAIADASVPVTHEIIHNLTSDDLFICLVNTGNGAPFISVLELRLMKNNTAYRTVSGSLNLFTRVDTGPETNQAIRYKNDIYDRIWRPFSFGSWNRINTSSTVDLDVHNDYQPPSAVMRTAAVAVNASESLTFQFQMNNSAAQFYVYLHFAEVRELQGDESRQMNISLNGLHWYGPFSPAYLYTTTVFSPSAIRGGRNQFRIYAAGNSTLPPILNAMEIYAVNEMKQPETDQINVDAIRSIKARCGIERNWQGDPCAPQAYSWNGLNCSYNNTPTIISLNLSSSGLIGEIPEYISKLSSIQVLDLSNNNLTGPLPGSLSELTNLKVLNLKGNRLNGTVPLELIERSNKKSLLLSLEGNPDLCSSPPCNKKKKKFVVPLVASVASFFILITIAFGIIWIIKRRKQDNHSNAGDNKTDHSAPDATSRQFSYSDVLKMTNNFQTVLGKGGFGTVYNGFLGDTQVAVKMLSSTSAQGYKQFQAEVKCLLRVHHKNLTSLIGYCDEGSNLGLVYEYMANGNLDAHLSGSGNDTICWDTRLRIAKEAAQGLEYLHSGCKPPIVHRDVKPTNILLNEDFQAKLADFGLSRTFAVEADTHVTTVVAGTPGYLDPEYYILNRLTEKSDVYSFGVVLLELITGRAVISKTGDEAVHISQWVSLMLSKGDLRSIVDPRLQGEFDTNSAWKVLELAMTCFSPNASERLSMTEIVTELSQCLAAEKEKEKGMELDHQDELLRNSIERMITVELGPDQSPRAR